MLNDKKIIAIIPARAGSKRIRKKNMVELGGKPLIQWTIEAAQKSSFIDKIIISTDDQSIIDLCTKLNVIYIERSPDLARDDSSTTDVLLDLLNTININQEYDNMILLQPTSPFRSWKHIDEALCVFKEKNAHSVISVTPCLHPPQWSNTIPDNGDMSNFLKPEFIGKRSQDFDPCYNLNGAIFISSISHYIKNKTFFMKEKVYAYIMPRDVSVDIDDYEDLEFAKFLLYKFH